jgi:hypothetical protein
VGGANFAARRACAMRMLQLGLQLGGRVLHLLFNHVRYMTIHLGLPMTILLVREEIRSFSNLWSFVSITAATFVLLQYTQGTISRTIKSYIERTIIHKFSMNCQYRIILFGVL